MPFSPLSPNWRKPVWKTQPRRHFISYNGNYPQHFHTKMSIKRRHFRYSQKYTASHLGESAPQSPSPKTSFFLLNAHYYPTSPQSDLSPPSNPSASHRNQPSHRPPTAISLPSHPSASLLPPFCLPSASLLPPFTHHVTICILRR